MATAITVNRLRYMFRCRLWTKTIGASATVVDGAGIVDMDLNDHVMWGIRRHSGTAITQVEILVSESSDMSSPVVLKTVGSLALDGTDDQAWIEMRKDEIVQKAAEDAGATQYTTRKDYRYAAPRLTGTNTDVATGVTIEDRREKYDTLTAPVTNN